MLSSPPPKLTHTRSAEQETRGLQRPRARCDGPLALTCQEAFSFILSISLSLPPFPFSLYLYLPFLTCTSKLNFAVPAFA